MTTDYYDCDDSGDYDDYDGYDDNDYANHDDYDDYTAYDYALRLNTTTDAHHYDYDIEYDYYCRDCRGYDYGDG